MKGSAPDPIDVEVGLTIRRLRKQRNMSQAEVSANAGVTFQQLQKYERAANRVSASALVKIAGALQVQPGDLLPKVDAPRLPPSAQLLTLAGAQELLESYAAIQSFRQRRLVRALVASVQKLHQDDDETDY